MAELNFILSQLTLGAYNFAQAVAALDELGFQYLGIPTDAAVAAYIQSLIAGGANPVASAVAPIPTIVEGPGAGVCATKSGNRGICCAAVTQLGLARAAQGFQYVNCNGKTVCLACGTKASTSKKHQGQTVFSVKRVSCGPSGCPALGGIQTIIPPI
jgi:hypothetical protein